MKDAPFADAAVMVYGDIRIKYAVFADDSVLTYGRMWMESYPVADDGIGADIGKGIDIDVLPDFCCRVDAGQRVDASLLRFNHLIQSEQFGDTLVGIVYFYECSVDGSFGFKVFVDQDDGRLGFINVVGVFGVGEERDGPGYPFFNLGEGVNCGIFVSDDILSDLMYV